MESRKYSINTKNAKRKEFFQTESQKVRLRRRKMKESNFETIKVIGRGGYGEEKKKKKFQKNKKKEEKIKKNYKKGATSKTERNKRILRNESDEKKPID